MIHRHRLARSHSLPRRDAAFKRTRRSRFGSIVLQRRKQPLLHESTESLASACERLVWNSAKKRWSQSLQRYGRTTIDRAFSITPLLFDLRTELLPQREHLVDIIPSDQKRLILRRCDSAPLVMERQPLETLTMPLRRTPQRQLAPLSFVRTADETTYPLVRQRT